MFHSQLSGGEILLPGISLILKTHPFKTSSFQFLASAFRSVSVCVPLSPALSLISPHEHARSADSWSPHVSSTFLLFPASRSPAAGKPLFLRGRRGDGMRVSRAVLFSRITGLNRAPRAPTPGRLRMKRGGGLCGSET